MSVNSVAVLGASDNPDRYSNMAVRLLKEHGYHVIPVNPDLDTVEGLQAAASLKEIDSGIHTLTMYVNPGKGLEYLQEILELKPGRVIFNPGTESAELENSLKRAGIASVRACTLVLLKTGQFEKQLN